MKPFLTKLILAALLVSALAFSASASDRLIGKVNCDILNVREQPSTTAAVKGKLKLGDQVLVAEQSDGWYKIRYNNEDFYVCSDYIDLLSGDAAPDKTAGVVSGSVVNLRETADMNGKVLAKYQKGTRLTVTDITGEWLAVTVGSVSGYMHSDYVSLAGGASAAPAVPGDPAAEALLDFAYQNLGVGYKAGGETPSGFDCSGFTRYVFKNFGISLTHSATAQSTEGTPVEKGDLKPADLVFFKNPDNSSAIGHVGIYVGNNSFIHATSPGDVVKVDSLDSKYYSKYYVCAARVLGN